jgi:hypothetical protein
MSVSRPRTTVPELATIAGPAPQRDRHRVVPVGVPAKLLPVPGHKQQRVIGARPEHQHVQDARALRVDGQARVRGEQVDQRLRAHQRGSHADHRQQPEHRAPVGDQQQDDHNRKRGVEQGAVDALERLARVGRCAQRAGQVGGHPIAVRHGDGADLAGGGGGRVPAVLAEVDGDGGLDRPPVARDHGPGDLPAHHALDIGETRRVRGRLRLVRRGDA